MLQHASKSLLYLGTFLALLLVFGSAFVTLAVPSSRDNRVVQLDATTIRLIQSDERCGVYVGSATYGDIDFHSCGSLIWNNADFYVYDYVRFSTPQNHFVLLGWSWTFVIAIAGPFFTYWSCVLLRNWKASQQAKRGLCVACGYDLRASPGACPECGLARRSTAMSG
ncbi:MAG: hypothetical protein ACE37H_06465 [Phycisphaeraceae bacterium]